MHSDKFLLRLLNRDSCLYRFNKYCRDMYDMAEKKKIIVNQELLKVFTEEALYALLNASFLYDLRDIE